MTTNTAESLRETLNRVDPNSIADVLRTLCLGDVLRALPVYLRGVSAGATGACAQQLATLGTVVLPEDAKAAVILRCTVNAAGVQTGDFTVEPYGTTPQTTQVAVAPNGDIVFLGNDAVTKADIIYVPQKGDVLGQLSNSKLGVTSLTLPVVPGTGKCLLPSSISGKVISLLQANVLAGTVSGQKIVLVPVTAAVATTKAALSVDGTAVWFAIADAVTSVQLDLLVYAGTVTGADVNALLEAASSDA